MLSFLRRHFLTGLLAITPLAITLWILWRVYYLVSLWVKPWVERVPGLGGAYPESVLTLIGLLVFLLGITLVGIFTRNLIGMAFFRLVERFFARIPVIKSVFSATKQLSEVFLQDRRTAFQKVVLFQYPREGLFSIGFITRDEATEQLVNVFLPTTPNPTSGYLLLVPRQDVKELDIPVEEAIKLIVSGGSIMTVAQADSLGTMVKGFGANQPGLEPGKDSECE
jgi:uncharacterized membrane protein